MRAKGLYIHRASRVCMVRSTLVGKNSALCNDYVWAAHSGLRYRGSRSQTFFKIGVLKKLAIFTEK